MDERARWAGWWAGSRVDGRLCTTPGDGVAHGRTAAPCALRPTRKRSDLSAPFACTCRAPARPQRVYGFNAADYGIDDAEAAEIAVRGGRLCEGGRAGTLAPVEVGGPSTGWLPACRTSWPLHRAHPPARPHRRPRSPPLTPTTTGCCRWTSSSACGACAAAAGGEGGCRGASVAAAATLPTTLPPTHHSMARFLRRRFPMPMPWPLWTPTAQPRPCPCPAARATRPS